MGVVQKTEGGDFPRVDTGMYDAVIRKPTDNPQGKYGPEVKFEVDLGTVDTLEHGVAPVTLIDYCSLKFSAGEKPSKLYRIAQACGFDVENLDEFDSDWLDGKKCRVFVEASPSTKGPGMHNAVKSYSGRRAQPATNGTDTPVAPKAGQPPADDDDLPF